MPRLLTKAEDFRQTHQSRDVRAREVNSRLSRIQLVRYNCPFVFLELDCHRPTEELDLDYAKCPRPVGVN